MSERERRYRYAIPRPRSPTFNPARATTDGFPSFYNGGDLPPMSATSLYDMMTPRGQTADYRPPGIPPSTTHHATYVVSDSAAARREPLRPRSSSHREHGRGHRSHSDATTRPIIVTTTKRPEAPSSHTSSNARPGSPTRDAYRSSDDGGSYYSQPASSLRPRSRQSYGGHHHPPYSAGLDNEEYRRQRDRQTAEDHYGHSRHDSHRTRPMSLYASMPPCKNAAPIDYDNGDVEYTNPGQLARYDLEHSRPEPRRRESLDRYHRPSTSISSDIGSRPYHDSSRRGPPPTTWGLDKMNQSLYEQPRVPISPLTSGFPRESQSRRLSGNLEVPNSPLRLRSNSRTRPVSLYQEEERRPSPPDQHPTHHHRGRGREDEQHVRRESRDRDHGRDSYAAPQTAIEQRGFGVVVDGKPVELHRREESRDRYRERDRDRYRDDDIDRVSDERRRERRERRKQYHSEPKRPSDDSLDRVIIRETERKPEKDDHKARKDSPRCDDDIKDGKSKDDKGSKDDKQVKEKKSDGSVDGMSQEPKRLRDTVAAGLSLAAASFGIGSALKDKEKDKDKERESESGKADKVVTVEKVGGDDRGSSRRRESVSAGAPPRPLDEAETRPAVREKPAPVVVESKPKPVAVHDEWEMVDRPPEHRRKPSPESMHVPDTHERSQPESDGRPSDDSADRIVLVERPIEAARAPKPSHEPAAADKEVEKKQAALPPSSTAEDQQPLRRFSRRARGEAGSAAFRPTDTADLVALKAQLAAQDTPTKETEKPASNPPAAPAEANPQPAQSAAPPPRPPKEAPSHREPSPERRRTSARDTSAERRRPRENSPARRSSPPSQRDDDVEFMDQSGSVVQQRDKNAGGSFDSTSSRGRELVGPHDERAVRVVSPPREKDDKKPLKGILKPSSKFPEPENFVREGVAPHKDDKTKKDVPAGARWTKIARKLVNPEALTIGKERFEVRDDSVIVLRVLSREEIEAYTVATAQLREMRLREYEKARDRDRRRDDDKDRERERDRDRDRDREGDDERRRTRRREKDEDSDDREPDRKDRARDRDDDRERERDRDRRERDRERERDRDRDRNRDRDRDEERRRPSRRHSDDDEDDDRSGYRSRRERPANDD
ncbi:hypothetical protein PspLS_07812 [Pyricularia sp. CBS 133598]|nr:hypothetical protein PspLS_07812 [Pyricularia sp. CBS 133598]